jgi:hypothetical protein
MGEPTSFFSTCPKRTNARLQSGYTRDALVRLLAAGDPISAYCVTCDVHWRITVQERYLVARGIGVKDQRDTHHRRRMITHRAGRLRDEGVSGSGNPPGRPRSSLNCPGMGGVFATALICALRRSYKWMSG